MLTTEQADTLIETLRDLRNAVKIETLRDLRKAVTAIHRLGLAGMPSDEVLFARIPETHRQEVKDLLAEINQSLE